MPCKGWLLSLVPSRSNASFRPKAVFTVNQPLTQIQR